MMLLDLKMRLSEPSDCRKHIPVLQPIITKIDTLEDVSRTQEIMDGVKKIAPMAAPPLFCAVKPGLLMGVEAVRRSMAEACAGDG